ncbi:MAG: cell division topological specificity factor MinE [Clostridiales bacterium]|jgi:cell division topological specificity factor|nr:cell division topological specificity factor MinE [Clostridiales bacterium]
MFDSFSKFFGKKEQNSKDIAKDRLKLVLIGDRTNISPEVLEMVKGEIIKVISNYVEIDTDGLDIQITRTVGEDGRSSVPALLANIPIKAAKAQK